MTKHGSIRRKGLTAGRYLASCLVVWIILVGFAVSAVDLESGLIGFWKLDGSLVDRSIYSNTATLVNSPRYGAGIQGQALFFTNAAGTQRYANLGHSAGITNISNQMSLSFWVYYTGPSGATRTGLVTRVNSSSSRNSWMVDITESPSYLRLTLYTNTSGGAAQGSSPVAFPSNTWTHVAVSWDGTQAVVYTNGVSNFGIACVNPVNRDAGCDVIAGTRGDTTSYVMNNGGLDEIRIYSRALTAQEVGAAMAGLSVGLTNLAAGTSLFEGSVLNGSFAASTGGWGVPFAIVSNANGSEVARLSSTTDSAAGWSVPVSNLTSAMAYSVTVCFTNGLGNGVATESLPFTWYRSSNITMTFEIRDTSGAVVPGAKVFGPGAASPFDGLRVGDGAGRVVFTGLMSGRTAAFTNFGPRDWTGEIRLINLTIPDSNETRIWTLEGKVSVPPAPAAMASATTLYAASGTEPLRVRLDLSRHPSPRVQVSLLPLAGGNRLNLFDQVVGGMGDACLEIPAERMKRLMGIGVWILETRLLSVGEDQSKAEVVRRLVFCR